MWLLQNCQKADNFGGTRRETSTSDDATRYCAVKDKVTNWSDGASLIEQLREGTWFGGLPMELQTLIAQSSVVRSYRRGESIVQQGEPTRGMFYVLEGRNRAVNLLDDGREVLIHIGEVGQ